jgi:hypothetical protein
MISKTGLIFLALTMLIIQPTMAEPKKPEWRSPAVEKIVKAQRQAILEEIKTLDHHEWAGSYYQGDGLGANITLELAPKTGFTYEWHGCLGLYDRNHGKVKRKGEQIKLQFVLKNEEDRHFGMAQDFIPISWGVRQYLVSPDDMMVFINTVNQGREPRMRPHGRFLLRRGDELKRVAGLPTLPKKYRRYLLARPIQAKIISVDQPTNRMGRFGPMGKEVKVTIDAGAKQGVWEEMEFFSSGPQRIPGGTFRVTKVEDNRSEGIVELIIEGRPGPEVGWQLSTLAP